MILAELRELLSEHTLNVLKSKGKDIVMPSFDLATPPGKIPGDLAANMALVLAKQIGEAPHKLAAEIIKAMSTHPLIEKAEVAGPGFINFWLKDQALRMELTTIFTPPAKSAKAEKILLEFVSANPTGPLHVGHGRGAALGDSLARIFKFLGYDISTEFYVNDSGGQIRKLGLSTEARVRELKGEPANFPEDGYKGSYLIDIAKEAIASGKKFTPVTPAQMVFDENDLAGYASRRNLERIKQILIGFGVTFDAWYTESTLHRANRVEQVIEELKQKNLAYEKDGAVWFKSTEFGDDKDRVLKKGNEAPTYFAADIAYHEDKYKRGYDRLINIWGADHHGYAQRVKGVLGSIGYDASKLVILFNQLVSIKGGRLSKRAGDMITLEEVVEEVGKDATRFFFALRSPGAHFEFDLDLAKKQAADNPVFYVQYVHARCVSIFREAEKRGVSTDLTLWIKDQPKEPLQKSERDVLLHLMSFSNVVSLCARDYSNHHLTVYLQELAGKYHSFYENCTVLVDDPSLRSFRLALVDAIRRRVAQGLDLLGVGAPDKL